ncbi:MAG: glycerophosphodiester phosphodiesterase [Ktedonobacteraceae bacterium]
MATGFQCVAHRGGSRLAPENTLAAFRTALTLSVDAIELDVQMTRDGHAIVFHDNTVEKLTDGAGNILDLDFAYLRSLNAAAHFPGGWPEPQRIPTLREVLDLARARTQVYVEIKTSKRDGTHGRYPDIAETVVKEIRAAGMLASVLIISFDLSVLPLIKSLEPSLKTAAIISEDIWDPKSENAFEGLLQQATALGVDWLNMDNNLFIPDMPERVHAHGLKLGCWTVNTLEEMRRLASTGIDSITSDRPDLFAHIPEKQ